MRSHLILFRGSFLLFNLNRPGALVPLDRRYDVIYRKDLSLAFLSPRLKAMNGIGLPHSYSGESGTVLAFKRLSSLPGMTTEEREFLPDQRGVIL